MALHVQLGGASGQQRTVALAGSELYLLIKVLGWGASGCVCLGKRKDNEELVAIKFIDRAKVNKRVERELKSLLHLCHPHVTRFRNVFLTSKYLAIVLEYCEGGTLFEYVRTRQSLPEHDARRFFQQLIIAVDYCHKLKFTHRDIKLENLLLNSSSNTLILSDFGLSKGATDSLPLSGVGTTHYFAPEVSCGTREYDGEKADSWSCGVVLYALLFHTFPFMRPEDEGGQAGLSRELERAREGDFGIPEWPTVSQECWNLLRHLFVPEPAQRFAMKDVLQNEWFLMGIPPGSLELNQECIRRKMSEEEQERKYAWIREVIRQASELPGAATH